MALKLRNRNGYDSSATWFETTCLTLIRLAPRVPAIVLSVAVLYGTLDGIAFGDVIGVIETVRVDGKGTAAHTKPHAPREQLTPQ